MVLHRFSLYGFLKNQQYYEPFLVLALLSMGLNFTLIGLLIGLRAVMLNLLEIPSGAAADLFGRRRSMVFSFVSYIVSFIIMGTIGAAAGRWHLPLWLLMLLLSVAMITFALGDAFRTGTHKAMIFAWLRIEGRTGERTRIYGLTRSFSKIGSAVSVVIASLFVYLTNNYTHIFFLAVIPYAVNIVNVLSYPQELDGEPTTGSRRQNMLRHLQSSLGNVVRRPGLRRLLFESMGFGGFFKAASGFLQPILAVTAIPVTAALLPAGEMTLAQRSVMLVGPVYFVLFLLSALASRRSHKLVSSLGGEEPAARALWVVNLIIFALLLPASLFGYMGLIIFLFVTLFALQNIWRPILVSRFDNESDESQGATILSVESQGKSLATMVFAPLLGFLVDSAAAGDLGATPFWPVSVLGSIIALGFVLTAKRSAPAAGEPPHKS